MKHENVVLFDNAGLPSVMVKFTPEAGKPLDPVFMVCGRRARAVCISKYANTLVRGVPCSIPFAEAENGMKFDMASEKCRSKGPGWHLMTNAEWMYLQNESIDRGTIPHGNTDRGSYYFDKSESGEKYDYGHTLTGSGPATWTHTHTPDGVCDLHGNNWEMVAGMRLKNGVVEYIKDNDAAAADLSPDSGAWRKVQTAAGENIYLNADGAELAITAKVPEYRFWNSCRFRDMRIELDEVPEVLKQLGIIPKNVEKETAYIYADTDGECMPIRGSCLNDYSGSGIAALNLFNTRSLINVNFRSAYVEFEELETEN